MKFFKNLFYVLLITLVVLVSIDIAVHVWFGNRYHLLFNAETFNNVVTPIVTVITAIAFVVVSFKQYKIVVQQNKIIVSQGSKSYYELKIKKIKKNFKDYVLLNTTDTQGNYNGLDWSDLLERTVYEVSMSEHYEEDLADYMLGIRKPISYYNQRDYFDPLSRTNLLIFKMHKKYQVLLKLIFQINNSHLIEEDKLHLNSKIQEEFLEKFFRYYTFERTISDQENDYHSIPILFDRSGDEVVFKNITETPRLRFVFNDLVDAIQSKSILEKRAKWKGEKLK